MKKYCILISGPTIVMDDELDSMFKGRIKILKSGDNQQIETIIEENRVDLILLEIPDNSTSEVETIKNIKGYGSKHSGIEIVIMCAKRETIVKALKHKATDAFKIPYEGYTNLIVERINVILNGIRC